MTTIFQKIISLDTEGLGAIITDPKTGKRLIKCELFGSTNAHQNLVLEYLSAVVIGLPSTPRPDPGLSDFGEIGYTLADNTAFNHLIPFTQSKQDGAASAYVSQAIRLYVPPSAKIFFAVPYFAGASAGGRLALTGHYSN
jgi:hypothetical protein